MKLSQGVRIREIRRRELDPFWSSLRAFEHASGTFNSSLKNLLEAHKHILRDA